MKHLLREMQNLNYRLILLQRLHDQLKLMVFFKTGLAREISNRQSRNAKLTTDLACEVSRASNAETIATSLINTENFHALASEGILSVNLFNETAGRKAAITAEATIRSDADMALDAKIAVEVVNRRAALQSVHQILDGNTEIEKSRAL